MIIDLPSPEGGRVLYEMLFLQPVSRKKSKQTDREPYIGGGGRKRPNICGL